jgi:hypothetical protein
VLRRMAHSDFERTIPIDSDPAGGDGLPAGR